MLETVIVESATPMTFNVLGADPNAMFTVKSISGLTSAKVGLLTGDYAGEGSYYQGRRGERLTPVITLKMNPDYANDIELSDLREMLYRTFYEPQPDMDGVLVRLVDDRKPDRYFVGYTEDVNTDQFSQSRDVQISMSCMESYLMSYNPTFDSDVVGWASIPIDYDGSARTGLRMDLEVKANTPVVTAEINGHKMILERDFADGDLITIDTRKGMRSIRVGTTDIMAALTAESKFLELDRPVNQVKIYGETEGDGAATMGYYEFRSQWWGI